MAVKAIVFGEDDMLGFLRPFYFAEIQRGLLDVIGTATEKQGRINLIATRGGRTRVNLTSR